MTLGGEPQGVGVLDSKVPQGRDPYRSLGVVGLALSVVSFINVVGFILSVTALVLPARKGYRTGIAIAGVIVSMVTIVITAGILALILPGVIGLFQTCAELGEGVHVVGNATYACTPTGSSVVVRP